VEGTVTINDENVPADHFALMANDGEQISVKAVDDVIVLVLSGEPIDEPIAAYGPFVMNNWKEVEQAIEDAHSGKFGVLEG
jgi:redox-sensitive bicupin YhaK (pirin superfamily)